MTSRLRLPAWSLAGLALAAAGARAEVVKLPDIGAHQPILVVEKNVNPQNKMVVYTKLDEQGRFQVDPSSRQQPVLDFYWLMNGRSYKPVNPLIKSEIRKRFGGAWSGRDRVDAFTVLVSDLKEVRCDIPQPKVEVCTRPTAQGPTVEAQMNLGPSDGNVRIKLSSIYTEGRAFPPAVDAVTLRGEEIVNGLPTGRKITRRYVARNRPD